MDIFAPNSDTQLLLWSEDSPPKMRADGQSVSDHHRAVNKQTGRSVL